MGQCDKVQIRQDLYSYLYFFVTRGIVVLHADVLTSHTTRVFCFFHIRNGEGTALGIALSECLLGNFRAIPRQLPRQPSAITELYLDSYRGADAS